MAYRDWTRDGEDWKDDEEAEANARDSVAAWYRRRIVAILAPRRECTPSCKDETFWESVLNWFEDNREEFLSWQDHETFAGPGYSSGRWVVDPAKVNLRFGYAIVFVVPLDRAIDQYLWLLNKPGWLPDAPKEPKGYDLLRACGDRGAKGRANRLYGAAWKRKAREPRPCRQCQKTFSPHMRGVKSCPECLPPRKPKKTKACAQCTKVFTPASGRQQRCNECRYPNGVKP